MSVQRVMLASEACQVYLGPKGRDCQDHRYVSQDLVLSLIFVKDKFDKIVTKNNNIQSSVIIVITYGNVQL